MKTIIENWRTILTFVLISLGFSILADIVDALSIASTNIPGLARLVNNLTGFSNFIGANVCAWVIGLGVGWPTLNKYGHPADPTADVAKTDVERANKVSLSESFYTGWATVGPHSRFYVYVAVCIGELIAAALCFN